MNSLILGRGEIGKAVSRVIQITDKVASYDIQDEDNRPSAADILHICFPYSDEFISEVKTYIATCLPEHVIIWSTVPIGTTKKIKGAVHSPIEGRHPMLDESIRNSVRWVGVNDESEKEFFTQYFKLMFIKTRVVDNSDFTEFLKLRSTAKYGINLVWTDYEAKVADSLEMDFTLVKKFDEDYNKLYHNLDVSWAKRYILDPPYGKIGGHCVVPNAEILDEQYPSELLKLIKEMK